MWLKKIQFSSRKEAAARVFEKKESQSSPELNDSFKAFLKEQKKKKKKPADLVLPSADVVIKKEKLDADLLTPIDVIKEPEIQTPNFVEGLRNIEIPSSVPSLPHDMRPSVNVTKKRPVYFASPIEEVNNNSPTSFDSTLDKIEGILSAEQTPRKETTLIHEFALKSRDFLSSTRINSPLGEEKFA